MAGSNGNNGHDLEESIDFSFRTDGGAGSGDSGARPLGDGMRMAENATRSEGHRSSPPATDLGELRGKKRNIEEILNLKDELSSELLDLRIPELELVERDMRQIGIDQYSEFWKPIMEFLDDWGIYTHENRIKAAYKHMQRVAKGLERTISKIDRKSDELHKSRQESERKLTLAGYLKRIYDCELSEMQAKEAELQGRKRELSAKRIGKPEALSKEAVPLIEQVIAIQSDIQRVKRKYAEVEDQIIMYDQRMETLGRLTHRVEANRLVLQKAYRHTRIQAADLEPYFIYGNGRDGAIKLLKEVQVTLSKYLGMSQALIEQEGRMAAIYQKQGMGSSDSTIRRNQAYGDLERSNADQRDQISHQANLILERLGI